MSTSSSSSEPFDKPHKAPLNPTTSDCEGPVTRLGDRQRRPHLIAWGGRLIVFFGAAHTLGALTVEGAANHAGAWFSRELWGEDLADMNPAMSAYWLTVNSFGPPLVLVGMTVLWLNRRDVAPPPFIPWAVGIWAVLDLMLSGPGLGQGLIVLVGAGLLLAGTRGAERPDDPGLPDATDLARHAT